MRIRKNASKILGSASTLMFSSYSPPKISSTSDIAAANSCSYSSSSSELSICELNCSPWDLFDSYNNDDHFNFNSVEDSKEERDCLKIKETATDSTNEKNKKVAKKIRYCTKRGKGWDCKKPARFPHSFCEYHLEKLRASMSKKIRKTSEISKNGAIYNKPTKLNASSESNSYYYYSGFGPWRRGKRRVRADVEVKEEEVAGSDKDKDEANDDDDDDKVVITYCKKTDGKKWHCKRPAQLPQSALCSHHLAQSQLYNSNYSKSGARHKIKRASKKVVNALKSKEDESETEEAGNIVDIAGDDEYDSYGAFDCDGEDIDGDDERNEHVNEGEVKKRRKPMKARSLKSLL